MIKLPLVGPAYKMQSQSISSQNCINWYPQTIEYPNGSRVAALMPTPGLKKIFQGITAAARCLHVLSNGALLVVIGTKLYHSKANKFELTEVGLISALGTVRVADNGRVALLVNGTYTYSLDLKKLTLERLSGSAIPRSSHVVFMDGRFVFNKASTGQFHWSDLYSTNVNALSYATAESTPDNITAIIKANPSELWLFGPQSVERYYGTGSANAPYSRLSGGAMSFGCLAPDSIVALATGVIWLGVSEFGGSQIVMSVGGSPERISTHALEEEIASYSKTSDAIAYAYQMEGHVFYVISFPSANVTFCYDVSTGLWHQRSFANPQGLHERHRSQHHAFYNNTHIVGDYRNGKLYQLDNNIFTDDGELILRERTAQAVITDNKLTRFNQLQIICETGFYGSTPKPAPQPPSISCTGALNITDWIDIDGDYGLEIEGAKISDSAPLLEVVDLLRANNFEVTIEEEPLIATPFAALNVDNDTEYRVSMNGTPLLNPATGVSAFKNLGKYPNFVVDGTTSFDLYMAVVTASGSKATAIGYQDSQVPPDHPLYTDKPILVMVTEETTGFGFEFEAISGDTDITQNTEYEQRLISNSDFPDVPLNGTIRKANNVVSCKVAGPEPKTMLSINSLPYSITDHWLSIECVAKNTLNNTATFTATDNLGNTFTEVRTDIPTSAVSIIFQIPRTTLVSQDPLTGTDFNFILTASDLEGTSRTVNGSFSIQG